MGILTLMVMVTMIPSTRYPASPRRGLLRTKPLKLSHYSSTRLRQSVHLLEMEPNVVLVLAPLRSPHASVIPCRPAQPLLQLHNPWLLPRQLACPPLLTDDRLRRPSAARPALPALTPGTTRFTLPLEVWTTSRRSTVVPLPPMRGEGLYHRMTIPMDMHTTMTTATTTAMTLSSMPIQWI